MNRQQKLQMIAELHQRVSEKWSHVPAPPDFGTDSEPCLLDDWNHPDADREYSEEVRRILAADVVKEASPAGASDIQTNSEGEGHMTDVRSAGPEATNHRKARFRIGWADAVNDQDYGPRVLERLTWQNAGWRLGKIFGETSDEMIEQMWDWAVEQQGGPGTRFTDD